MDIYATIAELVTLYRSLNEQLTFDPCRSTYDQVYRQEIYRDAYARLQTMDMEHLAVRLVAESVSDKALTRLRDLLRESIRICELRSDAFSSVRSEKLYAAWEAYLYADKRALILRDREIITDYPYPNEREREQLLRENREELAALDNERHSYRKENVAWIVKDYYMAICAASRSFASILDSYFPVEEKTATAVSTESFEQPTEAKSISPDEIFRSRMYDKFRELETRLVRSGDLDEELRWQAKHKNDKPDIKRLVTFLAGLLDNGYFLPNRDTAIKRFFEERYRIQIGQNFERRRREPLVKIYRTIFYDLPF